MEKSETAVLQPAQMLTAAQQKKAIAGSKVKKRKVVLNTLDSPLDLDWYFLNNTFYLFELLKSRLLFTGLKLVQNNRK